MPSFSAPFAIYISVTRVHKMPTATGCKSCSASAPAHRPKAMKPCAEDLIKLKRLSENVMLTWQLQISWVDGRNPTEAFNTSSFTGSISRIDDISKF